MSDNVERNETRYLPSPLEDKNKLAQQDSRLILEELYIVESSRLLGGRCILASGAGIQRINYVPVCDICGLKLNDEKVLVVCYTCQRKLCESCAVKYANRNYCYECLLDLIPLSKKGYKILVCVSHDIVKVEEISKLTRLSRDETFDNLDKLLSLGLLRMKGISIFSKRQVSEYGQEALSAYDQVYGSDQDIIQLRSEIQNHIASLNTKRGVQAVF